VITQAEVTNERRPEPVGEVQEKVIEGKEFKLGTSLGRELQDKIAKVIARHMNAFAWSSVDMPGIYPDFLCHRLSMHLTSCVISALSRFLSARGDKGYPYFQCLKKNNRFIWTHEWEDAFLKLKEYLGNPPVLCKPLPGTPLRLYFAVTDWAINSVIVQEQDQDQRLIYFVRKVIQGSKVRYQVIEKAALAVVFIARQLHHYFQSFTVIVMNDLPIRKVLQKPDIVGRMVRWEIEMSEFDVQYEPKGPIKGQLYADFMVELPSEAIK